MNNKLSVSWNKLLCDLDTIDAMIKFAFTDISTKEVLPMIRTGTDEFMYLISLGSEPYVKKLARKALRYRGYEL